MLTFPCPNCAKLLRAGEASLGKLMRCPGCKHTFNAPQKPFSLDPVPDPAPPPPPPPPPAPPPPAPVAKEEPLSLPLADDAPIPLQGDGDSEPFEDGDYATEDSSGSEPATKKKKKKKKKKRRREEINSLLDWYRYYAEGLGPFPFIIGVVVLMWLVCAGLTVAMPSFGLLMVLVGAICYTIGWFWFIFVAFKDETMYGVLVLVTQFFAFVYLFMNMEETWKPALVMLAGFLFAATGLGLMAALGPETAL